MELWWLVLLQGLIHLLTGHKERILFDSKPYAEWIPRSSLHDVFTASFELNSILYCALISNNQDDRFPRAQAKILDVPVFEKGASLQEDVLVAILEDVIPKHPEVHVWNLSLGGSTPCIDSAFSDFACFLDEMHDTHKCLFVVAAGNHQHVQKWPQDKDMGGADRVSSPGDSIRALTVGALASLHKANSLSKSEEPSPFSRRGPGPCFIPKPEVSHYGGNCTEQFTFAHAYFCLP